MAITASMVKDLRTKTGAGMMDCKKALVEAEGDMEKAVDILREKGLSQAAKKASRVAAEGAVVSAISADGKVGTIVEVNCETDFVGSNDDFRALAARIAQQIIAVNPADVEALLASDMDGKAVKDQVTEAVAKIGENISVRRFVRYESAEGTVHSYIHGGGKIGVLVEMSLCRSLQQILPTLIVLRYRRLKSNMKKKFWLSKLEMKANRKRSSRRWFLAVSTSTTRKSAS